jgi:drug/metabolite transporter (DMT)-like permease
VKKKTTRLLLYANILLLGISWLMFFYSYSRLPSRMPLWLNFLGQESMEGNKSPLLVIYPLAQTVFWLLFVAVARREIQRKESRPARAKPPLDDKIKSLVSGLKTEFVYLVLIFFNLVFIHVQRTLILVAHHKQQGIDVYYFAVIIAVILVLIPYYRIRIKLIGKIR